VNSTSTPKFFGVVTLFALLLALFSRDMRAAERTWTNTSGGNFNDNANWSGSTAPGNTDIAVFSTAGSYTVTFLADEVTNQLRIDGANPTFNLAGKIYSNDAIPFVSSSLIQVGVTASSSLTLDSSPSDGVLSADGIQVGSDVASGTLIVNSGATLTTAGSIELGGFGFGPAVGTLEINGGTVNAEGISIFSSSGVLAFNRGALNVTGSLFITSTGPQVIGSDTGTALMTVSGGSGFNQGLVLDSNATVNLSDSGHSVGGAGIDLSNGGNLNLVSGFLNTTSITGGTIGWDEGTITYGSNLTIGADVVGRPLGDNVTLDDKSLQLTDITNAALTIDATGTLVVNQTTFGRGALTAKSIANNGTFEFNKGSIAITDGNLTIGADDLTALSGGANVVLNVGDKLEVTNSSSNGTTTVDSGYELTLNGGQLDTDKLTTNGEVTYVHGQLSVNDQALAVGAGPGSGRINGSAALNLNQGGDSIMTDSSFTIDSGHTVNVAGGMIQSGSAGLTNNGTLTIGEEGAVYTGEATTNNSELTIDGGSLSTNSLSNTSTGSFTFERGILIVSSDDLDIGEDGIDAPSPVVLNENSHIEVFQGTTTVTSGRTLKVNGGRFETRYFGNESGLGTFEFQGGFVRIADDDLEIGANGINAPNPVVTLHAGDQLFVNDDAFTVPVGGTTTVAAGRELAISGGFFDTGDLIVEAGGTATFNNGSVVVKNENVNLHVVAPGSGGGISRPESGSPSESLVTIGTSSLIWVQEGTITIDPNQELHVNGNGSLRTKSIQEDAVDSFKYFHGELHLYKSDLVIEAGASLNDKRLLGANPVLISGDDVQIQDNTDGFTAPVLGNTTIKSGGSLKIHGGDFFTSADLTIEQGALLSGDDIDSAPIKAGLGGHLGQPDIGEFEGYAASVMTNNGQVSPGYAGLLGAGQLQYRGDYVQGATGELLIDLYSFAEFESSDQLRIGGIATLDGTLTLTLDEAYNWTVGDVFNVFVASGGIFGMFDEINYEPLPAGWSLQINYGANGGTTLQLTVVPEPVSGLLLACGMVILLGRRSGWSGVTRGRRFGC
jgi:hypothetical protein